jgi:hypothetical protein
MSKLSQEDEDSVVEMKRRIESRIRRTSVREKRKENLVVLL